MLRTTESSQHLGVQEPKKMTGKKCILCHEKPRRRKGLCGRCGGRERCTYPGCTRQARGREKLCQRHSPNKPLCRGPGCHKTPQVKGLMCRECAGVKYPPRKRSRAATKKPSNDIAPSIPPPAAPVKDENVAPAVANQPLEPGQVVVKQEPGQVVVKQEPGQVEYPSKGTSTALSQPQLKRKFSEFDGDSQLFRDLDAAGLLDDLPSSPEAEAQDERDIFGYRGDGINSVIDSNDLLQPYSFSEVEGDLLGKDLGLGGKEDLLVANAINDVGLTFDEFTKLVSDGEKPELGGPHMDKKLGGDPSDLLHELSMCYY